MTNREKFEEVFNIKLQENKVDACDLIDIGGRCIVLKGCGTCPADHFWEKEYESKENRT